MGLLGSDDKECYVCGKSVGEDPLKEDGKVFCCEKCKEHYEEETEQKDEICQFC